MTTTITATCIRPGCTRVQLARAGGYCNVHAYSEGALERQVPSGPALDHLDTLIRHGVSVPRITTMSNGVSQAGIYKLLDERPDVIRARTRRLLLAVPLPSYIESDEDRIIGRKVQALQAAGWTYVEMSRRCGISSRYLGSIARMVHKGYRYPETARNIDRMYRECGPTIIGPASDFAIEQGWVPPAAWDDINSDLVPPTLDNRCPVTTEMRRDAAAMLRHLKTDGWVEAGVIRRSDVSAIRNTRTQTSPEIATIIAREGSRILAQERSGRIG